MSNSVGIIFHDNWQEFSPLLYSHYGANLIPYELQKFLKESYDRYKTELDDGHIFSPCHMIVGLLQSMDKDIHMRIENLTESNINNLINTHKYPNCFSEGCWIINVSKYHFGEIRKDSDYYQLKNNNILTDEIRNMENRLLNEAYEGWFNIDKDGNN